MFDNCYGYIFAEYQSELDKITRWLLYLKMQYVYIHGFNNHTLHVF